MYKLFFLVVLISQFYICYANAEKSFKSRLLENFEKIGGDPVAFQQAFCFYEKHQTSSFIRTNLFPPGKPAEDLFLKNKNFIVIFDLNKPADRPRLFLINLKTSQVFGYLAAHGSAVPGLPVTLFEWDKTSSEVWEKILYPRKISNEPGSFATSRGIFILDETYNGKFGYSLRMHGLQKNINENALRRLVVLHGFNGMNPYVISSNDEDPPAVPRGNLALSQGCTMLEPQRAKDLIDQVKGGSLYYIYSEQEKVFGSNYCADENLMLKPLSEFH